MRRWRDQPNNFESYPNGDVMANSGYLEVQVEEDRVQIDFVRTVVAGQPENDSTGVVYSYRISIETIIGLCDS